MQKASGHTLTNEYGSEADDDSTVRAALERVDDFAPLYERHAMAIYRYCFNQTRDSDLANDLTAQVFVRAIERLHQYRPVKGATFRSWLFTIARNVVVDQWRRRRHVRPLNHELANAESDSPGPEEIVVHRQQMEGLVQALDSLPSRYQDIIHLRLAGLTTTEIASTLGVTESAVKSVQTRAYRRLRNILEPGRTARNEQ